MAFFALAGVFAGVGCGGRTGLWLLPEEGVVAADDGGVMDAALPPLDISVSNVPAACADAGSTLIYVVTEGGDLMSFDPAAPQPRFLLIGHLDCPTTGTCNRSAPTPFSMAVDRTGTAYVVYCDAELFRVSTATALCEATAFKAVAPFSSGFGMGFSQDESDPRETLYVASGDTTRNPPPSTLATVRTSDDALQVVGVFSPSIVRAELTGTGAGDLFAFYTPEGGVFAAIAQVDKTTARLTGELPLPGVQMGYGWAFVFWGGNFYTFTAPEHLTVVTRVNPSDGTMTAVAELGSSDLVVGAGVSTCAPQH